MVTWTRKPEIPTHMVTSSLHWTLVAMAVWMQLQTSVERISESPSFFKVPPSTCLCLTLHSQVFLITSCYSVFELLWSKCCWWESVIKPCRVTMALSAVYHLAAPLSEYSLTFPVKGLIFILLIVFNEAPALIAPPPMCHKPLYKHGGVLLTPLSTAHLNVTNETCCSSHLHHPLFGLCLCSLKMKRSL